jgi:hypothetical protein
MCTRLRYLPLALLVLLTGTPLATAVDKVDFELEVLPLLRAHCFRCHGSEKQEAGLRLDRRQAALAGGENGPVMIAGKPAESLLVERIRSTDDSTRMPIESRQLRREEISVLERWIAAGMPGLRDVDDTGEHWAFQLIQAPPVPATPKTSWPRNSIDAFVWHQLSLQDLEPAPRAEKGVLVRRLFLDLVGIPPTPDQLAACLQDPAPDSYEQLVDRLLGSPHFGERWGRHWLDVARYADSAGYEADIPRRIWHYRDWVIRSFNQDKPLDEFVIEQLGGDMLEKVTNETRVATGFHCNAMKDGGVRHESVFDRVNTTGAVFMGLTFECGQCHDHKTDPLTQQEYYQLYAFFNTGMITPLDLSDENVKKQRAEANAKVAVVDARLAEIEKEIEAGINDLVAVRRENREGLSEGVLALFDIPPDQRSMTDLKQLVTFFRLEHAEHKQLLESKPGILEGLPEADTTLTLTHTPQPTHLFVRGDHTQPGEQVESGVPAFLHSLRWAKEDHPHPNRADLGRWIVDRENPLFARVTANRFWMRLFGIPIVEPENDFGVQTPRPRHHELLDELACQLQQSNSIKQFIRLLVTSATYQQSSDFKYHLDIPDDLFLGQQRLRLEAEILRDNALAVSGLLVSQLGGPGVFPYQPEGILSFRATPATWTESSGADRYRRGMYTHIWRLTPHPMFTLFDGPGMTTSCTRRSRSNVAVQALGLLNGPTFVECAQAMGGQLVRKAGSDDQRIDRLFMLCLGRKPSEQEQRLVSQLYIEQHEIFTRDKNLAIAAVGEYLSAGADPARQAAWVAVSRTIMNLDEFITRE